MQRAQLLLRVGDANFSAIGRDDAAGIAHLAAGFGIERRLVGDQRHLVARLRAVYRLAVHHQRHDLALGGILGIAQKLGGARLLANVEPYRLGRRVTGPGPGGAGGGLLARHRGIEGGGIDAAALAAQDVLRQVQREAESVVQLEGDIAGQRAAGAQTAGFLLQQLQPAIQHLLEAVFLQLQRLDDQRLGAQQLRIGLAHLAHQCGHQTPQQRVAAAQHVGVAHGAAHNPAQHIAATLICRQHTVGNQEGTGAQMVGDHPVRGLERPVGIDAGRLGRGLDQGAHQVDVVIVVLALQHGGDALQPHAGIDRRARQRHPVARCALVELHEHQVPDFDEAVAILVRATRRPAGNLVAMVVEDFRARAARASIAHLPEIVGGADADDPVVGQAGDLLPQPVRLLVLGIDGDQQLFLGQAVFPGDQVPGQLDRLFLEIIAEGEIAQHLEESMVARGIADIFQVIMLAAGAHAFLRGRGPVIRPGLGAGEDVLELHHAGIGEQQGGIIARHQRAGGNDLVPVARKILQEGLADIVRRVHACNLLRLC